MSKTISCQLFPLLLLFVRVQVEALCRLIGIPNPRLSSAQLHYTASRWMGLLVMFEVRNIACL